MGNLGNFNANDYEPIDFEPLPKGDYVAAITDSEVKLTKAGNGKGLNLEWTVLEGECQNRKIFQWINLENPNEKAAEIGLRELAAVCQAVGVTEPGDSSELHDKPCVIKVRICPATDDYDETNEIVVYLLDADVKKPVYAEAESVTITVVIQKQSAKGYELEAIDPREGSPPTAHKFHITDSGLLTAIKIGEGVYATLSVIIDREEFTSKIEHHAHDHGHH